jgi:MFS family permease
MSSTADFTGEPAHRQHYNRTFAVLVLAGCTFALLQSLVAPALPEIQRDLNTTPTAVAWVLTAYLLSASVLTPIIGRLGDMFGKEHTLVASLSILGVGTLVAALAHSI